MLTRYTLGVVSLCSLLLFACNKKKSTVTTTPPDSTSTRIVADCPDISYLDSFALFTTNSPAEYDVVWDFGDSTISMEHNPSHLYNKMGKYYVKFSVNKDGSSPFVLYDSLTVTHKLFKRMEGMRNWHLSVHYDVFNERYIDSTYVYPDQNFGLTVQLPYYIVLPDNSIYKGATLTYVQTKNGQLNFWAFNSSAFPSEFEIFYNPDSDVITIKYTGFNKKPNSSGGATITSFVATATSY